MNLMYQHRRRHITPTRQEEAKRRQLQEDRFNVFGMYFIGFLFFYALVGGRGWAPFGISAVIAFIMARLLVH